MYDINQVSEITNLSKSTIYKKIKEINELKRYVVRDKDKSYILEDGLDLIKMSMKNKIINYNQEDEYKNEYEESIDINRIIINKDITEILIEQLREKDKQIQELINLNKNNQVLLKEEKIKKVDQLILEEHFQQFDEKLQILKNKLEDKREKKHKLFRWFKGLYS